MKLTTAQYQSIILTELERIHGERFFVSLFEIEAIIARMLALSKPSMKMDWSAFVAAINALKGQKRITAYSERSRILRELTYMPDGFEDDWGLGPYWEPKLVWVKLGDQPALKVCEDAED